MLDLTIMICFLVDLEQTKQTCSYDFFRFFALRSLANSMFQKVWVEEGRRYKNFNSMCALDIHV